MSEKPIPKAEEWWRWTPCEIHKVAYQPIIEQWNCDAALYPEHARVCREASGCCLNKLPDGAAGRRTLFMAKLFFRIVRRRTDNPRGPFSY